MPLFGFDSGSIVTASLVNVNVDATRMTALAYQDVTVSNTFVHTLVPGLSLPVSKFRWYIFHSLIMYTSSTVADIFLTFTGPVDTFFGLAVWCAGNSVSSGVTANNLDVGMITTSTELSFATGGAGAGTVMTASPCGYIAADRYSGTVSVSISQNTLEVSNTTIKQGSWISLTQVL